MSISIQKLIKRFFRKSKPIVGKASEIIKNNSLMVIPNPIRPQKNADGYVIYWRWRQRNYVSLDPNEPNHYSWSPDPNDWGKWYGWMRSYNKKWYNTYSAAKEAIESLNQLNTEYSQTEYKIIPIRLMIDGSIGLEKEMEKIVNEWYTENYFNPKRMTQEILKFLIEKSNNQMVTIPDVPQEERESIK